MLQVEGMILQRFKRLSDYSVPDVSSYFYEEDVLPRLAHTWTRLYLLKIDASSAELFEPRDKVWLFDLRLSKGIMVNQNFRLAVVVDAFNITDQLYWDRKELPVPRRWIQFGFELKFN